ncbi:DUF350 domain-containing protein [candidate division CSSED10-310 bacterium]|uniref:DUF350 domain-containing protein n=1 Tax=candidate division CSSED10-310 bacterium TaxID=2855610 RepID=A0ABV6Z318_UNCC1
MVANFFATIFYTIIGVILMGISFKLYDMITPFDINKELEEDKNIAIGIVLASIILGIAIIIAAAMIRCS